MIPKKLSFPIFKSIVHIFIKTAIMRCSGTFISSFKTIFGLIQIIIGLGESCFSGLKQYCGILKVLCSLPPSDIKVIKIQLKNHFPWSFLSFLCPSQIKVQWLNHSRVISFHSFQTIFGCYTTLKNWKCECKSVATISPFKAH